MDKAVFQNYDLKDKGRDVYNASMYWLIGKVISWGHKRIPEYFGAINFRRKNAPEESLTNADLSHLAAETIPYDKLQPFASQYLGINHTEWKNCVQIGNTTIQEKTVECLTLWRNKQNPEEAKIKLYKLLCNAGKREGRFDRSTFEFLAHGVRNTDEKCSKYTYENGRDLMLLPLYSTMNSPFAQKSF